MQTPYKQITIVSGKGGTGKTTVLASFAALAENKVLADCDVDAANLYLLLDPEPKVTEDFWGARIAVRDPDRCQKCGQCEAHCRFEAITVEEVNEANCEGCGLCVLVCPNEALHMKRIVNGVFYISETAYGPMVHARLKPAAENSGRLVSKVRQGAENVALEQDLPYILIDGPPGIGCTVTASLVDVDLALVVTEPSLSGMHDMERMVELAGHFQVPVAMIINKADINPENTATIGEFCNNHHIPLVAELPFDEVVVAANAAQKPLVEYDNGPVSQGITQAWARLGELLDYPAAGGLFLS